MLIDRLLSSLKSRWLGQRSGTAAWCHVAQHCVDLWCCHLHGTRDKADEELNGSTAQAFHSR